MDKACSEVADSKARIFMVLVFDSDLAILLAKLRAYGLLGKGYVFITADGFIAEAVVAGSEDPAQMVDDLAGWFQVTMNPTFGERGARFNSLLKVEPLPHLRTALFDVSEAILRSGECDAFCASIYDAIWATALAAAGAARLESGGIDPRALKERLWALEFEGASGLVAFDAETGERDASTIPMVIQNLQPGRPSRSEGSATLAIEVAWTWSMKAGLVRQSPEPPLWRGGVRTWEDGADVPSDGANCATGTIFSVSKLLCEPCLAGKYQDQQECVECPPGSVSGPRSTQCSPCQEGYQGLAGQAKCLSCPSNSARRPASPGISVAECLCLAGYFRRPARSASNATAADTALVNDCEPCVTGAECPGGDAMPHPQPGFWGDKACNVFAGGTKACASPFKFLECPQADNCKGGPSFACSNATTGVMCSETKEGYFVVGGLFYPECGNNGHLVTLVGVFAVLVVWFGINEFASGAYEAFNVALLFLQITGLISMYRLRWHPNLNVLNTALSIANFDVDFVTPGCFFAWTQTASFYLQLSLPLIFGCAYVVYYEARRLFSGTRVGGEVLTLPKHVMKRVMSLTLIVYHTLALKCFSAFQCFDVPDGRAFLTFMPEVCDLRCGSSRCVRGLTWSCGRWVAGRVLHHPAHPDDGDCGAIHSDHLSGTAGGVGVGGDETHAAEHAAHTGGDGAVGLHAPALRKPRQVLGGADHLAPAAHRVHRNHHFRADAAGVCAFVRMRIMICAYVRMCMGILRERG